VRGEGRARGYSRRKRRLSPDGDDSWEEQTRGIS